MKTLVVIPTYNEKENIPPLLKSISDFNLGVDVLVVDDNSPDGTGQIVENLKSEYPFLNLLSRAGKEGLGRAYIAGFEWGLSRDYDLLVEMDADFSHRPEDLRSILGEAKKADFIVGSRWVRGGGTVNWGVIRKIISRGGSFYARLILGYPLRDWTGGFNAWRAPVLRGIGLDTVKSNGYSFQIELKYRASKQNFVGKEVPILFEDRRVGQSKMSAKILLEALYRVWLMR